MGRSVGRRLDAIGTWYFKYPNEDDWTDEWEEFLYDLQCSIRSRFKSFELCDRWHDREGHVILENRLSEITLYSYCDLLSVSLTIKDDWYDYPTLARHWCEQIYDGLQEILKPYGLLIKQGTMSNGVSAYRKQGE